MFVVGGDLWVVRALNAVAGEPDGRLPVKVRVAGSERLDIVLRGDVHRGHGGACGLVVVDIFDGVDAELRLALVHARCEGLQRFVVMVEQGAGEQGDAVEREVRELLTALGVEGDACPVIRVAGQLDDKGDEGGLRASIVVALRELVAALDELPAFLAPAPLVEVPAEFAVEAALLAVVRPLYAPVTLFCYEESTRSVAEHVEMFGGGGTLLKQPPVVGDVVLPNCGYCERRMRLVQQFDARECVHSAPARHGVFRVVQCPRCGDSRAVHGEGAVVALDPGEDPRRRVRRVVADGLAWTLPGIRLFAAEHAWAAARLREIGGDDDVYERILACTGAGFVLDAWHAGGHHRNDMPDELEATPRCGVCGEACVLVFQDGVGVALWACREHPEYAVDDYQVAGMRARSHEPERPLVTVFVIGGAFSRLADGLRAEFDRAQARGMPATYRVRATRRLEVVLRPDVHRGHGGACGLIFADAAAGVDAELRLAVLHARREGLHRFVVLVEGDVTGRGDAALREIRNMLAALGVDGEACPCVRVDGVVHQHGEDQYVEYTRQANPSLGELVAALDELPVGLVPAPLGEVPAEFADEAALLDVVGSLYRPGTLLEGDVWYVREWLEDVGSGGSYVGAPPWCRDVDVEILKECAGCGRAMGVVAQFDAREGVHPVPPAHDLFRVHRCVDCDVCVVVHHGARLAAALHTEEDAERLVERLVPAGPIWTLPAPGLLAGEHPEAAARLRRLGGDEDVYGRLVACTGAGALMGQSVAGGFHFTWYDEACGVVATPDCSVCGARCVLVGQTAVEAGTLLTVWACGVHPEAAVVRVHA